MFCLILMNCIVFNLWTRFTFFHQICLYFAHSEQDIVYVGQNLSTIRQLDVLGFLLTADFLLAYIINIYRSNSVFDFL